MKGLLIYFDIQEGRQEEFEKAADVLISGVRENDPSYSLYSLAKIKDSSTQYVLVQRFESYESQLAHQTYEYVLEAMPAMTACLAGEPKIEWLDIVN